MSDARKEAFLNKRREQRMIEKKEAERAAKEKEEQAKKDAIKENEKAKEEEIAAKEKEEQAKKEAIDAIKKKAEEKRQKAKDKVRELNNQKTSHSSAFSFYGRAGNLAEKVAKDDLEEDDFLQFDTANPDFDALMAGNSELDETPVVETKIPSSPVASFLKKSEKLPRLPFANAITLKEIVKEEEPQKKSSSKRGL